MIPDEPEPIIVHLTRRTPSEQIDYLILQVSFLVARVNALSEDNEAMILAIKSLENRLAVVERAVPWRAPKPPLKPPTHR